MISLCTEHLRFIISPGGGGAVKRVDIKGGSLVTTSPPSRTPFRGVVIQLSL